MAGQTRGKGLFFGKMPRTILIAGGMSLMMAGCTETGPPKTRMQRMERPIASVSKGFRKDTEPERLADGKAGFSSDGFIQRLLSRYKARYLEKDKDDFEGFCWQLKLDCRGDGIRDDYAKAKMLYDLVRVGGILGNLAIEVKERPRLRRLLSGRMKSIGEDGYGRYPGKMMRDLFSETPRYVDAEGRPFFVFGDCDEYEMLYTTLLGYAGLKARVVMTADNHVNTSVSLGGQEVLIDNRFGLFGLERGCKRGCKDYVGGAAAKRYIKAINRLASAGSTVRIPPESASRIEDAIRSRLGLREGGERQ